MSNEDMEQTMEHWEYKEGGNAMYKDKDYRGAIAYYTLAIDSLHLSNSEADGDESGSGNADGNDNGDENNNDTNDTHFAISYSVEDKNVLATYYNNRAAAYTMILQYEDAISDCDQVLLFHRGFQKIYMRKAKVLTSLGRLSEANLVYSKALAYGGDPNDASVIALQKDLSTLIRRVDLVKDLLKIDTAATTKSSSTSTSTSQLLPNLPTKANASQALKQIVVILASCQSMKSILIYKLLSQITLGQYSDGIALSSTLIRSDQYKHNSDVILYRAFCLYQMGNLDNALKHVKQILTTLDPDHKLAFQMHKKLKTLGRYKADADNFYKKQQFDDAIRIYSLALDGDSDDSNSSSSSNITCEGIYRAKLYFNRASAHANVRNHTSVIEDCTSAVKLDDEYVKAYIRRASSRLLHEQCAEEDCMAAIRDYEKALELTERTGVNSNSPDDNSTSSNNNERQVQDLKKKIKAAQVQLKRSKQKDFYKILNVSRDAQEAEIKKAYRKAALKWHPDRHSNSSEEKKAEAEKVFKEINRAYEVLSDPTQKRRYDDGVDVEDLDNPHAGQGQGHGNPHGGMDPNVLFEMFMRQQQGGGGGMGGFHFG